MQQFLWLIVVLFIGTSCGGGGGGSPSPAGNSESVTDNTLPDGVPNPNGPNEIVTVTPTSTPSTTPTNIAVPSATANPTGTASPTATASPTGTASPTATASPTSTASPTATANPTGTASPTVTASPTGTASPTATASPTGTASPTATASPTSTASPTATANPTGTASPTATVSPTGTAEITPTIIVNPTATSTVSPTATANPTGTANPTPTASPTNTVSPTPTFAITPDPDEGTNENTNGNSANNRNENANENGGSNQQGAQNGNANGQNADNQVGQGPSDDEVDPEEEIKDSLSDSELEAQLAAAARVLDSQMHFEFKPAWHGPFDVYPQVRLLFTYIENDESFVLLSSQQKIAHGVWNHPKFFLVNLDTQSVQTYTPEISYKVIKAKHKEEGKFKILTRHEEKVYDIDFDKNNFKESKSSPRSLYNVKRQSISYRLKLDRVTPDIENPDSILWYKKKRSRDNWGQLSLDTFHIPRRIRSIHQNDDHLVLLLDRGIVQDHRSVQVDNLPFRAVHYQHNENGTYLLSQRGSVFELLSDEPVNIWLHKFFGVTEPMNPVPFVSADEKFRVLKAMSNNDSVKFFARNRERVIKKVDIDLIDKVSQKTSLSLDGIIDVGAADGAYYVLTRVDRKNFITRFDEDFNELGKLHLDGKLRNAKITIVDGSVYLISRRMILALDMGLVEKWSKSISGVVSLKVRKLPNEKLVGILFSHVVMIDPANGETRPLYTLGDTAFRYAKEMILIDNILYIHYGGSKIYEINLPYHEIAL